MKAAKHIGRVTLDDILGDDTKNESVDHQDTGCAESTDETVVGGD